MDVQRASVASIGEDQAFLARLTGAIAAARQAGMLVVYVVVQFRKDFPELSPQNFLFSNILSGRAGTQLRSEASELHPAVAPLPEDIIVKKVRVSAFCGSDL